MSQIHPTAIVSPEAVLGEGTTVGPFSIIGDHVRLGARCQVQEHVILRGHTHIGDDVKIFPFSVIGGEPQHLKYKGEPTTVEIGNRVTLRESVTVHVGTEFGNKTTTIGDDSYLMAFTHVAHDCIVGRNVIIANDVQLAGHTEVQDFATIGGQSAVAQFCRVGRYTYIGGGSIIRKDLAPFLVGKGNEFVVQGINAVGLTRQGYSPDALSRLKAVYKAFFLQGLTVNQAIEKIVTAHGEAEEVKVFLDFVRSSKIGFHR